jgi:hypothetical protein
MDKEKLKLIIKNLESLVECLKSEVYSDVDVYKQDLQYEEPIQYEEVASYLNDYDEVFYDDNDDLEDLIRVNQKYKLANDNDGDGL